MRGLYSWPELKILEAVGIMRRDRFIVMRPDWGRHRLRNRVGYDFNNSLINIFVGNNRYGRDKLHNLKKKTYGKF